MRRVRFSAALLAFLIALLPAAASGQSNGHLDRHLRPFGIAATPIPSFSRIEPGRVRFGAMEFLGGLVLESRHEHFGGISGLRFTGEDGRFLAVTDRARWITGRLVLDGMRPVGIEDAKIAAMVDANRSTMHLTSAFDTEALALGPGGEAYVGIERVNRILRFDITGSSLFAARVRDVEVPFSIRRLPHNRGIEGLVFVPQDRPLGGSLLAFSERALDRHGNIRAFILGGPTPGEFTVRRTNDFDITDAALIPGGDVLILERYFSWLRGIGMRVRLIPLADIRPGATVEGTVLIEAGNAHQIDNMEGIAVERGAGGETILTIVSDDNFSRLQRTLLLRFALIED